MPEREETAIDLLRELEWQDPDDPEGWWLKCPMCRGTKGLRSELSSIPEGHKADCRLDNFLNTVLVAKP